MKLEMAGDDRLYLRGPRPRLSVRKGDVRLVDLFSGCGGLTLGVEEASRQLGFHLDARLAVERHPDIAATYEANFSPVYGGGPQTVENWFDRNPFQALSEVERSSQRRVGRTDILVGGPPCQGHSTLNNHTRGDDPKNALYNVMVRAAEVLEPRMVMIENVPALERDSRNTLERSIKALTRLGYRVDHGVVSVTGIGVPQQRKRHVVLAHLTASPALSTAVDAASVERARTLEWAIRDLSDITASTMLDTAGVMSPENKKRAEYLLRTGEYDLPNRLRPACQRGPHKYKSMYGRLSWSEPAQTITTGFGSPGQGRYLHPERQRTLTPHEAARLQFLPDWFDFRPIRHRTFLAEAIGNAVPPKLAYVLARHLLALGLPARTRPRVTRSSFAVASP